MEPTTPDDAGAADAPSTDAASLDRLRRFGGGKLLNEMISLFVSTAPERLDAARAGLAAGDPTATEMAMHSLKSSSAQLGALRMQRLCAEGEELARQGTLEPIAPIMRDLDAEYPRVERWLERSRNTEA